MFSEYFQIVVRQRRTLSLFIQVHGGEFLKRNIIYKSRQGLHAARLPYVLWAECGGRKLVSFQLPVPESGHYVVTHCHMSTILQTAILYASYISIL
jgi:hypothetical protein